MERYEQSVEPDDWTLLSAVLLEADETEPGEPTELLVDVLRVPADTVRARHVSRPRDRALNVRRQLTTRPPPRRRASD